MRIYRWGAWLWLALLPGLAWSQAATPTWDELQKKYALPKDLPLSATREKLWETEDGALYKVTYRSINDQTVPALLFLPKRAKTPMPVVVLQHGLTGSKEQMLEERTKAALVRAGFAGFAIDAPLHGERKQPGKESTAFVGADKTPIYQEVADLRRAADYLATAPEVDAHRIGYYGVSLGGTMGALAAGLDERFRATVLVVAWGDWGTFMENSEPVKAAASAAGLYTELVRQFLADADPIYFVGHISPRPVLMQNGRQDRIVPPAAAEPLHKAARDPKEVRWYPGGHDLYTDPAAIGDAVQFLTANLQPKP
jgi:cephalosporin-C deacetylase-like acetyl esterase